jgi:hypothetical protein
MGWKRHDSHIYDKVRCCDSARSGAMVGSYAACGVLTYSFLLRVNKQQPWHEVFAGVVNPL